MKNIYLLLLLLCAQLLMAQDKNVPFEKEFFKDRKDEYKDAVKAIEDADDHIEVDQAYHVALELYMKAYLLNPNNAELNFKIGRCYMLSPNEDRSQALPFFQKSFKLDPNFNPDIHYYLGRGHHLQGHWDEAIAEYQKYAREHSNQPPISDYASIYKRIEECETGKRLEKAPLRVWIENVGDKVNSTFPDFCPVINADETLLMFTSRREGSTGGEQDRDFHFFEDIYMADAAKPGEWKSAANMGKVVNSEEHDATVGLSPDGTRMIMFREGDLYECDLKGNTWSKPEKLPKTVNSKFNEPSATLSFDGKKLYFVSNRPDLSMGGFDIFVSELNEKGEWGEPKNLGAPINTEYDEEGVFLHPDGRTLYFSSRGPGNMGGYDVFKSVLDAGKWGKPENLGYPINTPDDDVYFVVDATGKRAYYTSSKKGGVGEKDIYRIIMLGPEKPLALNTEDNLLASVAKPVANLVISKPLEITSNQMTLFKGVTLDEDTKLPVGASIEITDNEVNKVISTLSSNSQSGKFLVALPAGKNYGIAVKAPSYLFHSENFDIPELKGYAEVEKEVLLKPIKEGRIIVLRNIFFDFDKATLRPESERELQNVFNILKENPTIRVELSGHTDGKGSADYNLGLSDRRAKAVVDYLVSKGIPQSRLESKGYGLTKPIATNDTDEGRQLNRRTEFKILSK